MIGRIAGCFVIAFAVTMAGCGGMGTQEYKSLDGRYRVMLSGSPKIQEQTIATAVGPVVQKIAVTEDWSGTARVVLYADFPAALVHLGNRDAILEGACQGWATTAQMLIQSKTPFSISGHSGRDITFESLPGSKIGNATGRTRVFLVGNRLYQVIIAGPKGRLDAATMDSFLNSFALLDQGPGAPPPPPGPFPGMPGGPPPQIAKNQGNPPRPSNPRLSNPRPSNPRPSNPRLSNLRPSNPRPSNPGPSGPAQPPAATLALYDVPDPADAPIEADISGMGGTPRPAADRVTGLGGSPKATIPGARIRSFAWVDGDADMVGVFDNNAQPDGKRDHHFRLEIELPPTTIIESMSLRTDNFNRWDTKPNGQWWPLAVLQKGRAVCRAQVPQVGLFEGPQTFDLYVSTGIGPKPNDQAQVEVAISAGGEQATLTAKCQVPSTAPEPGQMTRPASAPEIAAAPSPPAEPAAPPAGPGGRPRVVGQLKDPQAKGNPSGGRESTAVPVLPSPSSGGATIVAFEWLDQDEDHVGTSGRVIAPGGGKDEHFQLVVDMPGASIIEAINVNGDGVLRWTTKPGFRTWPVAVVANQQPRNRAQALRLGAFSGRWTFDLYVESHDTVKPNQPFGVEVVFTSRGARHTMTARCERKK